MVFIGLLGLSGCFQSSSSRALFKLRGVGCGDFTAMGIVFRFRFFDFGRIGRLNMFCVGCVFIRCLAVVSACGLCLVYYCGDIQVGWFSFRLRSKTPRSES